MKKRNFAGSTIGMGTEHLSAAEMGLGQATPPHSATGALLLVSEDFELAAKLANDAKRLKRPILRVRSEPEVRRSLKKLQPGAVLLDLDLPQQAAWPIADSLLKDLASPPVILLAAGKSERFDIRAAIRAGGLVDKCWESAQILGIADTAVATQSSAPGTCNAMQRLWIRWLRPTGWHVSFTPSRRIPGVHD
jgi:CheY-like chemotaxis protein